MKALLINIPQKQIVRVYADSAIGRDVMPLFLPSAAGDWRAYVYLALRVGRLGKSVSSRFGARYIDAYSAVLMLMPKEFAPDQIKQLPDGNIVAHLSMVHTEAELSVMDSALTTGQWQPIGDCADIEVCDKIPLDIPATTGEIVGSIAVAGIANMAAEAVAIASRISTIKTGDILLIDGSQVITSLQANTYVRCTANGSEVLNVKIK